MLFYLLLVCIFVLPFVVLFVWLGYAESQSYEVEAVVTGKTFLSSGIGGSTERCVIEFDDKKEIAGNKGCKYDIGDKVIVKANGVTYDRIVRLAP